MNSSRTGNRRKLIDLIAIGLLFMIGIGGLTFVFYPVSVLPPKLPLLSTQHLPRSQLVARLQMPRDRQPDTREYFLRMKIDKSKEYPKDVTVWQYTTWYPDPAKPADEWETRTLDILSRLEPTFMNSVASDKPKSVLYCPNQRNSPDINFYEQTCFYLAFRGHWFTEVVFYSRGEEYFSYAEIQTIVDQVDQLLMAAPDEP
jgi:hypothetical protein